MSEANKFRIWSKKYKMFTSDPRWPSNQHTYEEFLLSPTGKVWCLVTADNENYFRDLSSEDDYIVQRATGLKDINNKEIYEGDIVKVGGNINPLIVEWFEVGAWGCGSLCFAEFEDDVVIFGNTLENPELA